MHCSPIPSNATGDTSSGTNSRMASIKSRSQQSSRRFSRCFQMLRITGFRTIRRWNWRAWKSSSRVNRARCSPKALSLDAQQGGNLGWTDRPYINLAYASSSFIASLANIIHTRFCLPLCSPFTYCESAVRNLSGIQS